MKSAMLLVAASVAAVSAMPVPWQNTMPFLMTMQKAVKSGSSTQQILTASTAPHGTKMGFMLPYLLLAEDSKGKTDPVLFSMMQNGAGEAGSTSLIDMWMLNAGYEDVKSDNDLMKDIMIMNMRNKAVGSDPVNVRSILPYMLMDDNDTNKVSNNDLSLMLALQNSKGANPTVGHNMMNTFMPYMLLKDSTGTTGKTNIGLMAMAAGLGSTAGTANPGLLPLFLKDSTSNKDDKDLLLMMAMGGGLGSKSTDVNSLLPFVLNKDDTTTTAGPNKLAWAYSQAAGMIG